MKAVILNSGVGSRMGALTEDKPKCLLSVSGSDTILSRQLKQLGSIGITDIVITIGPYGNIIPEYVKNRFPDLNVKYVFNKLYDSTNYIYSMFLAERFLRSDIVLLHGDIVMSQDVLNSLLNSKLNNTVIIDSTAHLPEKDFKASLNSYGCIQEIGISLKNKCNINFLLPVYKLSKDFMNSWMDEICNFVNKKNVKVYAENALNCILLELKLFGFDIQGSFCMEVDTEEDLEIAKVKVYE